MSHPSKHWWLAAALSALCFSACTVSTAEDAAEGTNEPDPTSSTDGGGVESDAGGGTDSGTGTETDAAAPAPTPRAPCDSGQCWQASVLSSYCGASTAGEDFSSGKYNVHAYTLEAPANVTVDLKLTVTGGSFSPALIVNAADGVTLFDGQLGAGGDDPAVTPLADGQAGATASLKLTAKEDTSLTVYVTSWDTIDSGFTAPMPTDAQYSLTTTLDCDPPDGTLLSPPNFDESDVVNGYYLLPDSDPAGLYTHKADGCSRGNELLIDMIYTVATHWKPLYPNAPLSPIHVMDMNEGPCSTVNHATHDDGTHVDLVADCATDIYCTNKAPKIALAKLIVDTGVACGILNNDTAVHQEINDYFAQKTNYAPWKGTFMRSVDGHVKHFHVRVKKPDGTCN